MMGLWLCKDYIRIERNNRLIEEVFKGQYYYRSMLIFANSQQFDLTANRNNIRTSQEQYEIATNAIKKFLEQIKNDSITKEYFARKKLEDEQREQEKQRKAIEQKKDTITSVLVNRLNAYKGRPDLIVPNISGAPLKQPVSEAETALLLQAMISSNHPGIDFKIGEYKTSQGTDLIVEYENKGIPSFAWAEMVVRLENLFSWQHPPEGIHKVICWELGKVHEIQKFTDGTEAKLMKRQKGRYNLQVGVDIIDVYILREILGEYS